MTYNTESRADSQAPNSPYLVNIQWGRFSLKIKDSPWSLAALSLTMLSTAAIVITGAMA